MSEVANNVVPFLPTPPKEKVLTFEEQMAINKAKKEKLAQERLEANKKVLRSYRIKQ